MYGETTVHIGNSKVEVEDNYMMHKDRQAVQDSVSTQSCMGLYRVDAN